MGFAANKRVENLIKEKNSKNVDLHVSTVSSSSEIVPLDQINLLSKEMAKQKIQKPAVSIWLHNRAHLIET